jgi:hypothetical protein
MRIAYDNEIDNTSYTLIASTEDASYPKENIQKLALNEVWHSDTDTAEYIGVDAGAGNTITVTVAIIAGHNITNSATVIKLQGSDDNFSSTPVDESFTYNSDKMYEFIGSASHRYWRVLVTDTTNPDSYIAIGRIFFGTYLTITNSFANSFEEVNNDTSTSSLSISGQTYGDIGIISKSYELNLPYMANAEKLNVTTFYEDVKTVDPYFLIFDENDLTTLAPIYCKNTTPMQFSHYKSAIWSARFAVQEVF